MNDNIMIGICLDASGSMRDLRSEVVEGFNAYLRDLQAQGLNAQLALATFSTFPHLCEVRPPAAVGRVQEMSFSDYRADGWTNLYDAVGDMIEMMDPQVSEGTGALLVIHTDGKENRSAKFTQRTIQKLVQKKENEGWRFLIIKVGDEGTAEQLGEDLGINVGSYRTVSRAATQASFSEITKETARL